MGTWSIWQRLLWKEWREGWPVLAICVVLPLLAQRMPVSYDWNPLYTSFSLVSILLTLWAVNRVYIQGSGRALARSVLPVPAFTRVAMIYLVPLALPIIAGIVIGFSLDEKEKLPAAVLFMLGNFALSTILAPVLTAVPAILAGVAWMFFAFDPGVATANNPLYPGVLLGALLAAIVWEVSARHQRYVVGRVVAVMMMVGAVAGGMLMGGGLQLSSEEAGVFASNVGRSLSNPKGITLEITSKKLPSAGMVDIIGRNYGNQIDTMANVKRDLTQTYQLHIYQNLRENRTQWVAIKSPAVPLGFLNDSTVLFAQQLEGEKSIRLLSWDIISRKYCEYNAIPADEDAIYRPEVGAKLSPDGRHAVLLLKSRLGIGSDLWLVDLSRKHAALVWPNYTGNALDINRYEGVYIADAAWTADRVILSINGSPVAINLKSWRAETMPLPLPGGTAQ